MLKHSSDKCMRKQSLIMSLNNKNHEAHRHGEQMQSSPGEGRDPPWVHLAAQGYIPTMALPFKEAWAATWVHSGDVWAWTAVGGYVWVHDPAL